MEQVVWSIGVTAAGWLREALATARNKEQQRFARIIEHAGTITAGLRALDREAHRLFLPIIYGDLRTWPKDKRERWAQDIVSLAHEDIVTPAIRISATTLTELLSQQADRDIARLVEMLLFLVEAEGKPWSSSSLLLNLIGNYDISLSERLQYLIKVLREPGQSDMEEVRATVSPFVRTNNTMTGMPHYLLEEAGFMEADDVSERIDTYFGALRPYADAVEGIFGQLLALQHRIFPQLPTPVWVWQSA
jgi:hypothetical protein